MHLRHYGALALLAWPAWAQAQTTSTPPPLVDAAQLIKDGVALHDAGKYKEAITRYRLVLPGDSAYTQAQTELALSLMSAERYQESVVAAQRAQALDPFEPELYNTLGSDYEGLKQPTEARQAYTTGHQLFPYHESLWINQGIFELNQHALPAALACLQRSVVLRPAKGSGHRLLGVAAIRQGQVSHAMLSWLLFLAIDPEGERSHDVLVDLEQLSQGGLVIEKEFQETPVAPNAAFEELDQLLKSKVALNAAYTSKVKFQASIVKQVQLLVEKFPLDADPASDFWLRAYAPIVRVLRQGDNLTTFTYLILSSADDKAAQQWLKGNKTKRDKLVDALTPPLLALRDEQPLPTGGGRAAAWFDGLRLDGLGPGQRDAKGDLQPSGDWLVMAKEGSVREKGTFTASGKRTGRWLLLRPDGTTEAEQPYNATGELDGLVRYYYPGGQLKSESPYRAGKLEGQSKVYGPGGELTQTRQLAGNDYEGEAIDYFANGQPRFKAQMHADKKNGVLEDFYADGTLWQHATYAQDQLQGESVLYYADKTVQKKATYDQGALSGPYATFYASGKPHEVGQYNKGQRAGTWKEYHSNGQLSLQETFDTTGELHGEYVEYDAQGRHYSTVQYEHGKLTRFTSFDAAGKAVADTPLKKGSTPVKTYDADGHLKSAGSVENGYFAGEWKTYFPDGAVREVQHYDGKGNLTGAGELYYRNGQLRQRRHYGPGGVAEGYFEQYYVDGQPSQTGYQRQGQEAGTWKQYYATGQLSQESDYFRGDLSGPVRAYTPGGQLAEARRYEFGQLRQLTAYDSTGTALDQLDLKPTAREVVLHFSGRSGKVLSRAGFRDGYYEGPTTWLWPGGKPEAEGTMHAGRRWGRHATYYPSGQLHTEDHYFDGQRYSTYTTYYPSGQPRLQGHYLAGEPVGEWTYYFTTGKTEWTVPYNDEGELDGPTRFYNPAGELLQTKNYVQGLLVSISGPAGGTGQPLPPAGALNTLFATGKPAAQETYDHGYPTGTATFYYASGQVFRRSEYQKGLLSGPTTSYWPSGKLLEETNYLHNELHGRCRYYRPDGTLEREETYRAGERVGPSISYDAQGRKVQSDYFWNNASYNPQ